MGLQNDVIAFNSTHD